MSYMQPREAFNVTVQCNQLAKPFKAVGMEVLTDMQNAMLAEPDAITNFDQFMTHHHSRGVYGREMFIPAGMVIVSKIHRYSCITVMLEGTLQIVGNHGSREVKAGDVFITEPHAKRAVRAVTDVRILTCHGTQETDLQAIEQELIEPEPAKELGVDCDIIGRVF